ncbi:MAG: GTPase Era [Gemmatimonadaceae bacterium]|nr:GTPase Era [Gemmatimonadaceae bacterium]
MCRHSATSTTPAVRSHPYLPRMSRAGIVTVTGRPNAGKSTLLNRLVGQKLAITSAKPQSTRNRVVGILSDSDSQLILLDTPGLLEPRYALHESMRVVALSAVADADVIVYLNDASQGLAADLASAAGLEVPPRAPIITAYNKVDLVPDSTIDALRKLDPNALFISAASGEGIDRLLNTIARLLPVSPFLYGTEEISTQPLRFFVTELIREAAFELLADELPYAVACEIEEFREDRQPVYIRAVLYVERESQKRILVGAGGSRIRDLGRAAREKVEALVERPIYLDLWVKVLHNWRRNVPALRRLGYPLPKEDHS